MPMPSSLRLSLLAWTLAVAAGVAETGLAVTPVVAAGGPVLDLLPVLALRGLVYSAAAALVIALARRRRWARIALAICLSTIGLASMALPPCWPTSPPGTCRAPPSSPCAARTSRPW